MDKAARGQLVDLPVDECWQLLTTTPVGRIAWSTTSGPVVVPVNFVVDGRTIRIRTAAYSAMVQKADVERVAFQADHIDETSHSGWSVLARGRAEVRYGEPADAAGPEPWPRGPRSATVVIDVDEVTGRWLNPGER
ncbi:pyridoxamine 5'-phosphate oxidase family protein [Nocardioides sp.]|uniref:pyridoxamine 5'-phosphate oxidase family protein n=1 Tax=Nocardioides sp. TaxID=35761 RepID=UPI002609B7A3|nr:pyridoxamine 5'-phosphate oxidase family protein [Nocardioides sp.]MDI6912151.1 pyridoxamine 5'-phosphate oxidase family protein [Nocardioides sp.]